MIAAFTSVKLILRRSSNGKMQNSKFSGTTSNFIFAKWRKLGADCPSSSWIDESKLLYNCNCAQLWSSYRFCAALSLGIICHWKNRPIAKSRVKDLETSTKKEADKAIREGLLPVVTESSWIGSWSCAFEQEERLFKAFKKKLSIF